MNTTHRDYSEAAGDFNRLARFFIEHNRYLRLGSTWSLSRLADWKYGLYENCLLYTSLPKSALTHYLGTLSSDKMAALDAALRVALDLRD